MTDRITLIRHRSASGFGELNPDVDNFRHRTGMAVTEHLIASLPANGSRHTLLSAFDERKPMINPRIHIGDRARPGALLGALEAHHASPLAAEWSNEAMHRDAGAALAYDLESILNNNIVAAALALGGGRVQRDREIVLPEDFAQELVPDAVKEAVQNVGDLDRDPLKLAQAAAYAGNLILTNTFRICPPDLLAGAPAPEQQR